MRMQYQDGHGEDANGRTRADARGMAWILSGLLLVGMLAASLAAVTSHAAAAGRVARATASPIRPYTHAPDYAWVAGKLERSDLEGGFWMIRYQKPGQKPDAHGGHFVLKMTDAQVKTLRADTLVVVYGHILKDAVGIDMAGTMYLVTKIAALGTP